MHYPRHCALAVLATVACAPVATSQEASARTELGTVEVIGQRIPAALALTTDTIAPKISRCSTATICRRRWNWCPASAR